MAGNLQTFSVPAVGGLDLVSPPQLLADKAGFATTLNNYEAMAEGGYRRINGFAKYGDIPDVISSEDLRGIAYYKGLVVLVGNRLLHSPNGQTWFVVNVAEASETPSNDLAGKTLIPRLGDGNANFVTAIEGGKEVLIITNADNVPASLLIEGDKYTYIESTNTNTSDYLYSVKYQDHIVIAGGDKHPNSIAVSARFSPLDFSGTGSWAAQVQDKITGIHSFRDYLYIFCRSSIYRVINLESAANAAIRPVTTKIGCVDGRTIQEVGGDILFLAADGLRYLGATERIDDVSLNVVSNLIRPLLNSMAPLLGPVSSIVIPSKSQYRLFFTTKAGAHVGVIGTLSGEGVFQWSTTDDLFVSTITNAAEDRNEIYHAGSPTTGVMRVYQHDTGDSFDGTPIVSTWDSPYYHMGDASVRKNLHLLNLYLESEGTAEVEARFTYDHEKPTVLQPEPYILEPVVEASRWGESQWGNFTYGAVRYPLDDIFLEGSGKWIKLQIKDVADNAPYVIRGYDLQTTTAGRI